MTKPIQIRDEEAVSAIREAAALGNRSMTDVVKEGVKLILDRERHRAGAANRDRDIDQLLAEIRALPRVGPIPTDEDFYDEDGFPK